MKTGVELIADERERQVSKEGWTPQHDDTHIKGQISKAAACYALGSDYVEFDHINRGQLKWPWRTQDYKPTNDRVRELSKSGALIAAEIDRLQRLRGVATIEWSENAKECESTIQSLRLQLHELEKRNKFLDDANEDLLEAAQLDTAAIKQKDAALIEASKDLRPTEAIRDNDLLSQIKQALSLTAATEYSPKIMDKLKQELTAWLDGQDITSKNIGFVRRQCFVPWDSEWNSIAREETAERENKPCSREPVSSGL